jgi:hypothetical protein
VPGRAAEYFLPATAAVPDAGEAGILYRPALVAQAEVGFTNRKYDLDTELRCAALVEEPDRKGNVRWDDFPAEPLEERKLDRGPKAGARFAPLEAPLSNASLLKSMERDFEDWAYRTSEVLVKANETLKVFAGPDVDDEAFVAMCQQAADKERSAEIKKLEAGYDRKIASVQSKLKREERELAQDEAELAARKREEVGKHLETALSFLGGRKKSLSGSLTKRRLTEKAKMDVEESVDVIADYQRETEALEQEKVDAIAEVDSKWADVVADVTEIPVAPYKKDVAVTLFGVGWVPYYVVESGGRTREVLAFEVK